jgi:uncharacterized membrane protein
VTYTLLKTIHLLALVFGSAASLGNIYILLASGPHDLPAPGFVGALRKWYRLTALLAILTLWITGVMLIVMQSGWAQGTAFDAKLFFAALLLGIVGFLNFMAPRWARRGGPPSYVAKIHMAGAASLLLAVVFAVAAFN